MQPANTPWQRKWLKLDCHSEPVQRMATEAEQFCARWFRNEREKGLLILAGECNCGKTHTAQAIYRWAMHSAFTAYASGKGKTWSGGHVPSVLFARWPEVACEIHADNFAILPDLIDSDLLVLDDIGAENDPWKKCADRLCQVLTRRERKHTVITTNIEPSSWQSVFDTRIADRLLRNSTVVNLFGLRSYAFLEAAI